MVQEDCMPFDHREMRILHIDDLPAFAVWRGTLTTSYQSEAPMTMKYNSATTLTCPMAKGMDVNSPAFPFFSHQKIPVVTPHCPPRRGRAPSILDMGVVIFGSQMHGHL